MEHDVRKEFFGCKGLWVLYTCATCEVTIQSDNKSLIDGKEWEKTLKNFLNDHPCSNIKDETQYRIIRNDEDYL